MVVTKSMQPHLHCFSETDFWRLFPHNLYPHNLCQNRRPIPRNVVQRGVQRIHPSVCCDVSFVRCETDRNNRTVRTEGAVVKMTDACDGYQRNDLL